MVNRARRHRTARPSGLEPVLAEFAAEARPAEEFVHDLHRQLRRRRSERRLATRLGAYRPHLRGIQADERLRLLERSLGELRNRQLAHRHLELVAAKAPEASHRTALRRAARLLDVEIRERAVEARWLAQTSRRLVMRAAAGRAADGRAGSPKKEWRRESTRQYRRFRKVLRIARRTRGEEDLHRLRQQLRRLQLVADLSPKWSRPSDAAARRVDRTIASLGELHDLDVLRQVFRGLPIGSAGRLVVEAIGRRRRKLERKVEVLLRSRRLMRFGRPA